MSWASEFPEELLCRPNGLVLLSGLDTANNPVHQSVWEAFSSNRKLDRVPLKFKLHHGDEYPKTKPKVGYQSIFILNLVSRLNSSTSELLALKLYKMFLFVF